MTRFLAVLIGACLLYVPLLWYDSRPADDPLDTALVVLTTATFGLVALGMLVGTSEWKQREFGLFYACLGLTILFGRATALRFGWLGPTTLAEPVVDAARLALLVGAILLLWSIALWVDQRWGAGHRRALRARWRRGRGGADA